MRKTREGFLFWCLIIILLLFSSPARAQKVTAVVSRNINLYLEALAGFKESFKGAVESYTFIGDPIKNRLSRGRILGSNCDLYFFVGSYAATQAKEVIGVKPVVYCLILKPEAFGLTGSKVAGISLEMPPLARMLSLIKEVAPQENKVGFLYASGAGSGPLVSKAEEEGRKLGITVITAGVRNETELPTVFRQLGNEVKYIILSLDQLLMNDASFSYIVKTSLEMKVAVLVSGEVYARRGAFCSVVPDIKDIGRLAGELANQITSSPRKNFQVVPPRKYNIVINSRVARLLGIKIPSTLEGVKVIR